MNKQQTPYRAVSVEDIISFGQKIWDGRKVIIKCALIGVIPGLLFAILTPKSFTVTTTMVPQSNQSSSKLSGLSSIAAMAGFNLDMSGSDVDISPVVYPQIVQSVPFQLELMNTPYNFSDVKKPVTFFEYYSNLSQPGVLDVLMKYTVGLPGVIVKAIRGTTRPQSSKDGLIRITKDQEELRRMLEKCVTLTVDKKEGFLTLTSTFDEPLLAAQVAEKAQLLLQQTITEYKTKKASEQLRFIEQRFKEKKSDYENAQSKLAWYKDRNQFVNSAMANTELERLQSEYNIAYSVYSELAKQLENAKIQVKEETPVFAIIKPVVVPIEKTKPNRFLILFVWIVLGVATGFGIVFGKEPLKTFKERINKKTEKVAE